MAPRLEGGQLVMPTHNFELDAANATTSVGPVNFVGQDLPALGNEWQVETQFTVTHTGGWQGVGLMLWRADNNFFRSSLTHSLTAGNIYIEQSKDNPTTAEGARQQAGGNVTILPAKGEVTIRMRYTRAAGSNTVAAQYQVIAPESAANADWVNFPGAANFLNLDTGATTPRRDSAGSRVGIYAGGNFPGTTGTHQYPGTPAIVEVDYFRVTPDVCPEPDVAAPVTTAQLDGAAPVPTYDGPVDVRLSATDEPDDGDPFSLFGAGAFAGAMAEHQVNAAGTSWDPNQVDAALGDVVTWNFPAATAGFTHDVWVVAPDEAPGSAGTQVTSGPVNPGGPPVSYTPDQEGEWTYVCKLHSFVSGGQWTGMVGKIDVTDTGGPVPDVTGVDYTEYRVDGASAWTRSDNDAEADPFVTTFGVSGNGDHTVEYRSVDGAGNTEAAKSVAFTIEPPDTTPPETTVQLNGAAPAATYSGAVTATFGATDASGVKRTEYKVDSAADWTTYAPASPPQVSGDGDHTIQYRSVDNVDNAEAAKTVAFRIQPTQPGGGGTQPPAGGGDPPPAAKPFVGLSRLSKTSLAQFRSRGVRITVTCNKAMSGRAVLQVTRKTSRKLKLKSTTLASRAVRCTQPGSMSVTLKPAKKVGRALAKARGTVKGTLVVRMTAPGEAPTTASRTLSMKRR
jgi:plastocyanin